MAEEKFHLSAIYHEQTNPVENAGLEEFLKEFNDYINRELALSGEYDSHIIHLENLRDYYVENIFPVISTAENINSKLDALGIKKLQINDQVELKKINKPEDILDISTDKGDNFAANFSLKAKQQPVEYRELKEWHKYGSHDSFTRFSNHTYKPAFKRMFILFHDFTSGLVSEFNMLDKEHRNSLEAELFVAYQIMSRLVDKRDPYVIQNGVLDPNYLTR